MHYAVLSLDAAPCRFDVDMPGGEKKQWLSRVSMVYYKNTNTLTVRVQVGITRVDKETGAVEVNGRADQPSDGAGPVEYWDATGGLGSAKQLGDDGVRALS